MSNPIPVRPAQASDIPALESIIRGCGLFTTDEADGFVGTLPSQFDSAEPDPDGMGNAGSLWLLAAQGAGAAYLSPEVGPGVWNLLFLGVMPEMRRHGVGRALVAEAEAQARGRGGRMLLIDTSSAPPQAPARALYEALGYGRVGSIPDYWGPGDGKITFYRPL